MRTVECDIDPHVDGVGGVSPVAPIVSVEYELWAMKIALAATQSLHEDRPVEVCEI